MQQLLFSLTDNLSNWAGLLQAAGSIGSLVLLEAVLSADNAVALAGIVSNVYPNSLRSQILNQGLLFAFMLRAITVIGAAWLIHFDAVRILGGLYLVWLAIRHFQEQFDPDIQCQERYTLTGLERWRLMALIALTDLAFSIDSVSAAVAMVDNVLYVILGGAVGVLMLRFIATAMVAWMSQYEDLANAAYLTVLAVGLRMLARCFAPNLAPSQTMMILLMTGLFLWGFSRRQEDTSIHVQSLKMKGQSAFNGTEASDYVSAGRPTGTSPVLSRTNTTTL